MMSILLVWFKIMLLGWAWIWLWPHALSPTDDRLKRWLFTGLGAALIGALMTSLSTLILAEFGRFTPDMELGVRAALFGIGMGIGIALDRRRLLRLLVASAPVSLLLLAGTVIIMKSSDRGEWILGGWDPGIYANEGMAAARTGTFYPDDSFFYEELTEEEWQIFTRSGKNRTERFPGVLIQPERQSFTFQFFRLTPAWYAALARSGGLPAILRGNAILGMLALLAFAAVALQLYNIRTMFFTVLLLAASPVFLFYSHTPTTEIFQLTLTGTMVLLLFGTRSDTSSNVLLVLLVLAAVLNRFSCLPFIGILLACSATGDCLDADRKAAWMRRALLIAACAAGAWIDFLIAPASLKGWNALPLILGVGIAGAGAALLVDIAGFSRSLREGLRHLKPLWLDIGAGLFLLGVIVTWFLRGHIGFDNDADNLVRLFPFTGILPLIVAAIGLLIVLFMRPRTSPYGTAAMLFFFFTGWMLVIHKNITDLYPWALRRYIPYLVPFIALSCGYALDRLWRMKSIRPAGAIAALTVFVFLLVQPGQSSDRAWRYTEYNGVSAVLEDIAEQIGANDVVIADHPWWGTPLALMHGKKMLDGKRLWSDESGERMKTALRAFERMAKNETRIRFLTSTGDGIEIYPIDSTAVTLDWTSSEVTFQEVIQHPRADEFALRTKTKTFRLYTWRP